MPTAPHTDDLLAHILRIKRPLLTSSEVVDALGISLSTLYDMIDAGELESHDMRRRQQETDLLGTPIKPEAGSLANRTRRTFKVTRRSVIAHIIGTANYDLGAETIVQVIGKLLPDLPSTALDAVAKRASTIIAARRLQDAGSAAA